MGLGIRRAGVAVTAAALLAGLAGTSAVAAPGATAASADAGAGQDRAALREAMNELAAAGAAGVQVRVHDRLGDWTGSAGVRELGREEKPSTDGRFRAGSITKTFVATVVLQLVGEGKVGLDDPVDRFLPRFGLDRRITVRMLLQHTSGLFNYTGEPKADGTVDPGIPLWGQEFVDNRFHTYKPEELVRIALSKPARFAPGTGWSYSNTNYLLAGLLIEKLTGTPYATQVERRIVRPLGLHGTSLPGTRTGIAGPHAHGYFGYQDSGKLKVADVTELNPSWAGAAGEIISTTKDLDTFISALLGGRLLAPRQLAEMRKFNVTGDVGRDGLGLFQVDFGPGCSAIGHTGGVQNYTSYMYSSADGGTRFEMSVNHGVVDAFDPAAREKFDDAQKKVAASVLCDNPRRAGGR
ncbi:serine hydrolase domain-containing protein [Streptomyces sp. NPDC002537]